MLRSLTLIAVLMLLPQSTSALTLVQALGVFYIFLGLFLTATIFTFATGVFVYLARLGTWPSYRDVAIKVLEWAVAMLFVLIVLLGIVQFFQTYPSTALFILAVIVIAVVGFFIFRAAAEGGKKKKDDDEH